MNYVPETMKAAILFELGKELVFAEDVKLPKSLAPGQVLVKIHYSGICGSQIGEIDGVKGQDKYIPHLLGHEGTGTVVMLGPGVRYVTENQQVILHWRKSQGIESETPFYEWQGERINAGWVTTFNEYAIVSENRLTPLPPNVNMRTAALYGCAVTTGIGVVTRNANLSIGESVVVFGAGGIGLSIIQAASLVSANPIVAIDIHDSKLLLAKKLGATHVINSADSSIDRVIRTVLEDRPLDVFIDNTGKPEIIELGYNLLSPSGRLVLVGVPAQNQKISIHSLPIHFGKKIVGSHGGEAVPHVDIPRYNALYSKNLLDLDVLITHEYPLRKINAAIEDMRSGKVTGRCIIKVSEDA